MSAEDERQLREFRAECDKVGIPYDAAGLVRHHRGGAAVAAGAEAFGQVLEAERERDRVVQGVRAWLARAEPHPELNGDKFAELRALIETSP